MVLRTVRSTMVRSTTDDTCQMAIVALTLALAMVDLSRLNPEAAISFTAVDTLIDWDSPFLGSILECLL